LKKLLLQDNLTFLFNKLDDYLGELNEVNFNDLYIRICILEM